MKNLLLITAAALTSALLLSSCKDDDNGKLPDNVKIYINGQDKTNKAITFSEAMTVAEICRFDSLEMVEQYAHGGCGSAIFTIAGLGNCAIDTINNRLSIAANQVDALEDNSWLLKDSHFLIRNGHYRGGAPISDTLGYVPRAQHNAAVDKLTELFKDKENNWSEIYRIFTEAFIFVPCTAEEYRALEAAGLN